MATARKPMTIAEPKDFEGLTLMHMRVEGIKRIRLVDISLSDTITTIGGDNAHGKSSLLDSYVYCMRGKTAMKLDPIAHGRQQGVALCDFGDGQEVKLSVKRTIKRVGDTDFTADLELNIPGHVTPSRVEEFLRELTGAMSFDPMSLDRMSDAERYEAFKKLVDGFDFAANSAQRDQADRRRRDINREHKREQAAADAIQIDETAPAERIDEAALTAELQTAGERNLEIQQRTSNRETVAQMIASARAVIEHAPAALEASRAEIIGRRERTVARLQEQIKALEQQIKIAETECEDALARETARLNAETTAATGKVETLQGKLDSAEPLPEPVDTQALADRLVAAQKSNRLLADWEGQRARKLAHSREADRLAAQSDELTATMTELDHARTAAIEAAQLPVDGLGFGDGYITLGGVPWVEASTAERVDASTAVAMALQPMLKVILIRNGSDLGTAMRERIRARAAERGYRVLMEVVDDSGSTSITLENGEVKVPAEAVA